MGIRVTPASDEARPFDYYGIRLYLKYQNSAQALSVRRRELVSELGMTEEEWGEQPQSARDAIFGRAFIGTIVTGFDPFELEEEGETRVIRFDAPSDLPDYETMGEELLGEDKMLRDAVLERSVNIEHFRVAREARSLGNSNAPSDSGPSSDSAT